MAERSAFAQSIARLHHLSSAAVTTLGKVMLDATPPATKVRAADSILDHTAKAVEIEDIEARVAALEQPAPRMRSRGDEAAHGPDFQARKAISSD